MFLRLGLAALIGLGCSPGLAKSLLSYVDADEDPCAPFAGKFDNVCLWYRSENVVFACKTRRFLPTDGADIVVLQADGEVQKMCDFWTERPGTVLEDPLWSSSDSSDDEHIDPEPAQENQPKIQARSPQWTPMYRHDYRRIPMDTRCNPHNTSQVQVFRHGWYPAYDCPREYSCIDIARTNMPGRAGCDNIDGTYEIPDPHGFEPDMKKRTVEDPADEPIHYDSRCSPANERIIQRFNSGKWVDDYTCPLSTPCLDLHGLATCELGAGIYYIPSAKASSDIGKARRQAPPEKALHSWDTRCNPQNMTEVQRFDEDHWVLHAVCPIENGCKDVNGIGACYLGNHHYDLPAANDTIDRDVPLASPPFLMQQKCNEKNPREIMIRTMHGWKVNSYCIEPYVCEDFLDAGFAICVDPDVGQTTSRTIYKPWTHAEAVASADGIDTPTVRCRSEEELVRFNGSAWLHDSYCTNGWKCHNDERKPHIGGCRSRFTLPELINARSTDYEDHGTFSSDSDNEAPHARRNHARDADHDGTFSSDSDSEADHPGQLHARDIDVNEVADTRSSDSDSDEPKTTSIHARDADADSDSADENIEQILEAGNGGLDEGHPMLRQLKYRGMHERRVGVFNPDV